MAIEVSNKYQSERHSSFSQPVEKKWLLQKEQLEAIASLLESLDQRFVLNYEGTEERLPELQDRCFEIVFEMCEQEMWSSLTKARDGIQGLTDSSGNTVLSNYVRRNDIKKIQSIVNASLVQTLSKGSTPLHISVKMGQSADEVEKLLKNGCGKPIHQDCKGRLAVHIAVKEGRFDLVERLLPKNEKLGVGVYVPYHSKKQNLDLNPLTLAVLKGQVACFVELKKIGHESLDAIRIGGTITDMGNE